MKKKILALTLAAFTFGIVAANAQNQTNNDATCKAQSECCQKDAKKEAKREARAKLNPFNGIELTADQQAQLKALKEQQKADRKKEKDAKKDAKREAMEKERAAYDAQIAKILTPEQYKTYEANKQAMREAREQKMKRVKDKMQRRHGGEFKSERKNNTAVM